MKVMIQGRAYQGVAGDDITLSDLMAIKSATGMTRADLFDLIERVSKLSEAEQQRSDEALIAAGISVWLARRHAGELLSLEEACAVPMTEVEFVREPGDPEPVGDGSPAGRPDPTRRPGSGRRSTPSPQDHKPKKGAASKTSKKRSPAGS